MGVRAVELLLEGKSGRAVGFKCNEVIDVTLDDCLLQEKAFEHNLYEMARVLSV